MSRKRKSPNKPPPPPTDIAAPPKGRPGKAWFLSLALVGLVALATRLLFLNEALAKDLIGGLYLDSAYYAGVASRIASDLGAGDHVYLLSPLYPYFLSLFIDAQGHFDVGAVRVVQCLFGAATAILAALTARRISGQNAGMLAGIIVALYGPLVLMDGFLLIESLDAFFITLAVWLLVGARLNETMTSDAASRPLDAQPAGPPDDKGPIATVEQGQHPDQRNPSGKPRPVLRFLGVGLTLGIAAALRPTGLLLAVVVLGTLWLPVLRRRVTPGGWRQASKASAALLTGVLLIVTPFTIHNVAKGKEWVLLSANGGFNFWIGNADPDKVLEVLTNYYSGEEDPIAKDLASNIEGRLFTYKEASDWWYGRAIDEILIEPREWLILMFTKGVTFFHPAEIPQLGDSFQWYRDRSAMLRFPVDARHMLLLALFSPLLLWASRDQHALRRARWPVAIAATYALSVCLFFVLGRYRISIMPTMIILASVSLATIGRLFSSGVRRDRLRAAWIAPLLLLVIGGSYLLFDRAGAPFEFQDDFSLEELQAGRRLAAMGRHEEALEAFHRSLARENYAGTRLSLAQSLRALGRSEEAEQEYKEALRINPKNSMCWYELGTLRQETGDLAGAAEAFSETITLQPLYPKAHFGLGCISTDLEDWGTAVRAMERFLKLADPDDPLRPEAERIRDEALQAMRR